MSRSCATRRLPAPDQVLTLSAALMAVAAASLLAQPAQAEGLYVDGAPGAPMYQYRFTDAYASKPDAGALFLGVKMGF